MRFENLSSNCERAFSIVSQISKMEEDFFDFSHSNPHFVNFAARKVQFFKFSENVIVAEDAKRSDATSVFRPFDGGQGVYWVSSEYTTRFIRYLVHVSGTRTRTRVITSSNRWDCGLEVGRGSRYRLGTRRVCFGGTVVRSGAVTVADAGSSVRGAAPLICFQPIRAAFVRSNEKQSVSTHVLSALFIFAASAIDTHVRFAG
ncbi:hypothetical protein U1Q18_050891 [Sarracenia purpurea var. burkii]